MGAATAFTKTMTVAQDAVPLETGPGDGNTLPAPAPVKETDIEEENRCTRRRNQRGHAHVAVGSEAAVEADRPAPDPMSDLNLVAHYWRTHGADYLDAASATFFNFVQPASCFGLEPFIDDETLRRLFTEWMLFDFPCCDGKTPLEQFVVHPVGADEGQRLRLARIADSQFFSRFEILYKDRATDFCTLVDVGDGHRYDVLAPRICRTERWRKGTIGLRIAHHDGPWVPISVSYLYDRAPARDTAVDGAGFVHPEDVRLRPDAPRVSFFLRMLRDLFGIDGRYRHSTTILKAVQPG